LRIGHSPGGRWRPVPHVGLTALQVGILAARGKTGGESGPITPV